MLVRQWKGQWLVKSSASSCTENVPVNSSVVHWYTCKPVFEGASPPVPIEGCRDTKTFLGQMPPKSASLQCSFQYNAIGYMYKHDIMQWWQTHDHFCPLTFIQQWKLHLTSASYVCLSSQYLLYLLVFMMLESLQQLLLINLKANSRFYSNLHALYRLVLTATTCRHTCTSCCHYWQ